MRSYIAPAICEACGTFHLRQQYAPNGSVRKQRCGRCRQGLHFLDEDGYYTELDVLKEFPEGHPWDVANVRFKCPKCHKLSLVFEFGGNWD